MASGVSVAILLVFFVQALAKDAALNMPSDAQESMGKLFGNLVSRAFTLWSPQRSTLDESALVKGERSSMTSTMPWRHPPSTVKTTKRETDPMYRTFDEFLTCPLATRHATPIHSIEFGFVNDLLHEPDDHWKLSMAEPGVKIQRKFTNHSNCVLVRAYMDFPNIEPDIVLYKLIDFKSRSEWDHILFDPEKVKEIGQTSSILYFNMPSPVPLVKDRDWVLYERIQGENTPSGNGYSLLQRSAEHARKPPRKACIRAESLIGGAAWHRPAGSSTTRFSMVAFTDPLGKLPKWLVNMVASRKLYQNMDSLRDASATLQAVASKDPALRAKISDTVARFHEQQCS